MLYNLYFQQTTNLVFLEKHCYQFFFQLSNVSLDTAWYGVCLNVAGRDSQVEVAGAGAG